MNKDLLGKNKKIFKQSSLEAQFAAQIKFMKLPPPVAEHRFHPKRKWRFDFAWVDIKLAVELQGLLWAGKGRHQNAANLDNEYTKENEAVLLGWRVLKFSSRQVQSGEAITWIKENYFKK